MSKPQRPGRWARDRARENIAAWARINWRAVVAVGAVFAFEAVVVQFVGPPPLVHGMLLGAIAMLLVGVLALTAVVGSGSHSKVLGIAGEGFTASEFERLARRRQGWRVFHGLVIGEHEIDHVAIGPGGVLAIETKFVGTGTWQVTADGLAGQFGDPLAQARRSRDKVKLLLNVSAYGERLSVDVHTVLIAWGPGAPTIEAGHATVGGVELFSGRHEDAWREWLDVHRLDKDTMKRATACVEAFLVRSLTSRAERAHGR